jgi:hypothetical protein
MPALVVNGLLLVGGEQNDTEIKAQAATDPTAKVFLRVSSLIPTSSSRETTHNPRLTMSYMLEFPRSPLPPDINSPPYVIFGMYGKHVHSTEQRYLPPDISLALVLHFAPKMKKWVLPSPTFLTKADKSLSLRKLFVGINITEEGVSQRGLFFILRRMMQLAGLPCDRQTFNVNPDIADSVKVLTTWRALELPEEGKRGVEIHLLATLMQGPPVELHEIDDLWHAFPSNSQIVREMGHNYVRSWLNWSYPQTERARQKSWFLEHKDLRRFLMSLEDEYLKDPKKKDSVKEISTTRKDKKGNHVVPAGVMEKGADILERERTRRVSVSERKEREGRDSLELQRRLRRLKSDDSIRSIETAIFDPAPTPPAKEPEKNSRGTLAGLFSKPADGSFVANALEQYEKGVKLAKKLASVWDNKDTDWVDDDSSDGDASHTDHDSDAGPGISRSSADKAILGADGSVDGPTPAVIVRGRLGGAAEAPKRAANSATGRESKKKKKKTNIKLAYSDKSISPEEKMAALPRYAATARKPPASYQNSEMQLDGKLVRELDGEPEALTEKSGDESDDPYGHSDEEAWLDVGASVNALECSSVRRRAAAMRRRNAQPLRIGYRN